MAGRKAAPNLDGQGRNTSNVLPFDPTQYRPRQEVIERRWLEEWAPKYGLDPRLSGKARAVAMARATGLLPLLPQREPGDDFEEDAHR